MARVWSLLTLADEDRQFSGNAGYDDDITSHYSYDSTVPNHGHVGVGDLAVLRDGTHFLGYGRIERIETREGEKDRFRCPDCRRTGFKRRSSVLPRYRCSCGATFDTPIVERLRGLTVFRAVYGSSWRDLDVPIPVSSATAVYLSQAAQHAIRGLDPHSWRHLVARETGFPDPRLDDSVEMIGLSGHSLSVTRVRIGQQAFRERLVQRYGWSCVFTGPQPPAALEAAHLYSYAEVSAHSVDGGLLMRRDLHALFDRWLIAVDPGSWTASVSPVLESYPDLWALHGKPLYFSGPNRPRQDLLSTHLAVFRSLIPQ